MLRPKNPRGPLAKNATSFDHKKEPARNNKKPAKKILEPA